MRLNHTTVAQRRARHAQRVLTKNRCPMGNHPLQPQMRNPTRQTAYTEAEGAQYSGVKTHTIQHKLQYHTHNAIKASNMHRNRIDRTVIAPSAWRQSTASSPSSACRHHSPHHCCTHVRCNTHKRTTMCTRRVRMPPLCLCPRPKTAAAVRLSPGPWRLSHPTTHADTPHHTTTHTHRHHGDRGHAAGAYHLPTPHQTAHPKTAHTTTPPPSNGRNTPPATHCLCAPHTRARTA